MSLFDEVLVVAKDLAQEGRVMEATAMMVEACKGYGNTPDERNAHALDQAISALAEPMVGQILMSSGGYEQTRCHFYQVVATTAKSVKVVSIGKTTFSDGGHYGGTDRHVIPVPIDYPANPKAFNRGDALTKRVKRYAPYGYYVAMSSHENAYLWNGKPGHEHGDH